MQTKLYRIDHEQAEQLDLSLTGGLPDPLSFLIDDGVLVPVVPCEHGNYAPHIDPYVVHWQIDNADMERCDGKPEEDR